MKHTYLISLLIASLTASANAQQNFQHWQPATPSADQLPPATSNISIAPVGPGDLLSVYVASYPEVTKSYRVALDGSITLPVVDKPINVNQRYVEDVQKMVAKTLTDAGMIIDPVVSVAVLEYRSMPVTIVGAVHQPTTLQAVGDLRVLEAISKAGGLSPEAGPTIVVSRPELNGQPAYVRRISVKDLMQQPDSLSNLSLQGGEEIRVPNVEKYYVVGNVKSPGAYPMEQANGFTVLQALAVSQGTLSFSHATAVIYRKNPTTAERQEIEIPLRKIIKRQNKDVTLEANDILYVPDDSGRRLSATVVDRIVGFGATTGSGLLIWGNR